jgi:hypothetical protein
VAEQRTHPDDVHGSNEAQHCQVQHSKAAKQSLPKAPASQQQQRRPFSEISIQQSTLLH